MDDQLNYTMNNVTNATDIITNNASKILTRNLILLTTSSFVLLVNLFCFITVLRDKNLKAKRFDMMAICLSISDFIYSGVLFFATIQNLAKIRVPFYCYVIFSLFQTTMVFSMLQMMMICIERLLATFPTVRNPLLKVPILPLNLFLGCLCLVVVFPVFAHLSDIHTLVCTIYAMAENGLLMGYGVFQPFLLCIIVVILVSYAITIYRIYSAWKATLKHRQQTVQTSNRIPTIDNDLSTKTSSREPKSFKIHPFEPKAGSSSKGIKNPVPKTSSNKLKQVIKMAITLGMLVVILLVSWMPRMVYGLWILEDPQGYLADLDTVAAAEMIVNISPFLNPVIYVIRIPRFRRRMFSCCIKQEENYHGNST